MLDLAASGILQPTSMIELLGGVITLVVEAVSAVVASLDRRPPRTPSARHRERVDRWDAWLRAKGVTTTTSRKERTP